MIILIVNCDTDFECHQANITFSTNANCNIICSANNARENSHIQSPTNNGNCIVTCSADSACKNENIKWTDGEHSSFFTLDCLTDGSYRCTSQSIWLPPKSGTATNCIVYVRGDSFSGGNRNSARPQLFYG